MKYFALVATASALKFENMNEDQLLVQLSTHLDSALTSETRGDGDAAVAKTAAIKNIQKALTARILKRLDEVQPIRPIKRTHRLCHTLKPMPKKVKKKSALVGITPIIPNQSR